MDGLIVIDKPVGPTSHDIVARVRRALRSSRVGHTGTLDPAASGVLPLVVGRATRLARYLSAADKSYLAVVRFGHATDTYDAQGRTIGPVAAGPLPDRDRIDRVLDEFRGTFFQQPPQFSAKRVAGRRSYDIARSEGQTPLLPAVSVTAHAIETVGVEGDCVTLRVECSSGFYVRSLAHDLGVRLGTGAHLASLRRTRSGELSLEQAVRVEELDASPSAVADRLIPMRLMLPALTAVRLTAEGVLRARHGRDLGVEDFLNPPAEETSVDRPYRLLDAAGDLVGLARPAHVPGLLHPSVVLM